MPADVLEPLINHPHLYGSNFKGYYDFLPEEHNLATYQQMMGLVKKAAPSMVQAGMFFCGTEDDIVSQLGKFVEAGMKLAILEPASALVSKDDALFSTLATQRIARKLRR